jgi:electron transfer flavoprotein alpha subunit
MSDIFVYIEHFRGAVAEITYMNLAMAQNIAQTTGSKVVGLLLGSNAKKLADNLAADEVLYIDHPALAEFTYDSTIKVLADLISDKQPQLVLFGDTTIGSDIAGGLSAKQNLPLVSFCSEITAEGGGLKYVSKICGGKINIEGNLPDETVLVSLLPGKFKMEEGQSTAAPAIIDQAAPDLDDPRVKLVEFVEPSGEDIDISKENILIGIGRGIESEDNVELAEELAEALSGAVCASRPVIDQGWLSTTRLVGKSGKSIKPKLYIAMGISGAPEHIESIGGSELIIAVNTDPNAPIFNLAQYGITEDLLDIAEALTEAINEAKGG